MQKRWIILFVALLSISFLGLFYSGHEGVFTDIDSNLNFADIAWMITATIFVLMMTFLLGNIMTVILLVIYFLCRRRMDRQHQLDKMNIQDL